MTIDQFDNTSFGSKTQVIYDGKYYSVFAVDFQEKLIAIDEFGSYDPTFDSPDNLSWKRCENCELVNE